MGLSGRPSAGTKNQYPLDVCRVVNSIYRPLIVGGDVRDVEAHWERMWATRVNLNNRGIHSLDLAKHCVLTQAIAAVDIALWDALGKSLGEPVYKLMRGFRDRIPVIAIGGYLREGAALLDLDGEIENYKEQGIFGMKMKVGKLSVEEDIERARRARAAGGPNFHLCTDSNQAWTVDEAMRFARGVRDLNIAWLEEPVRWYDQIEGNARVRSVGIPVNAGQGEISRHGCRELMARGAVDIINVDATIAAGVTEWRRVAGMAHSFGVGMAHHEEPQVALHLLAGIAHGLCVEIFPDYSRDPMWFDLPVARPMIRDGYMQLPQEAGFGFELSAQTIERWAAPEQSG